jgi:hypothetical protein
MICEISLLKEEWKRREIYCKMLGISLKKAHYIDFNELEMMCIKAGYLEVKP